MLKVLVISHYVPPYNEVASLRVGDWIEALCSTGFEVDVLTTRKGLLDEQPFSSRSSVIALKTRVWQSIYSLAWRINSFVKQYIPLFLFHRHMIWLIKEFISPTFQREYDLVISSSSPIHVHMIAWIYVKKNDAKWIADLRDLWVDNHLVRYQGIVRWLETHVERFYLGRASYIVVVSRGAKLTLNARGYDRVKVLMNGVKFNKSELINTEQCVTPVSGCASDLKIVYTGTLYDLFPLKEIFDVIECADGVSLACYGNASRSILELLRSYENCRYLGKLDYGAALSKQRDADILLFFGHFDRKRADVTNGGVISGKIFEYLESGRPIIALVENSSRELQHLIEPFEGVYCVSYSDFKSFDFSKIDLSPCKRDLREFNRLDNFERFIRENIL